MVEVRASKPFSHPACLLVLQMRADVLLLIVRSPWAARSLLQGWSLVPPPAPKSSLARAQTPKTYFVRFQRAIPIRSAIARATATWANRGRDAMDGGGDDVELRGDDVEEVASLTQANDFFHLRFGKF